MNGSWLRFMDVVTPDGGAVVAFAEIYVDESGTHGGSPFLGVGGYIFKKNKAKQFSRIWAAECRAKNIPYFHMTDCALGFGIYKNWSLKDRIDHEKKLIALIHKYSEFGFAMIMSESLYRENLSHVNRSQIKPYVTLLAYCLAAVNGWILRSGFSGRPSFFFESGHEHASEAGDYILTVTKSTDKRYSKAPFAFVSKSDAPPLQAADLLVWLARNAVMKMDKEKPVRKDFIALIQENHEIKYYDEAILDALISAYDGDKSKIPATRHHNFVVKVPS